MFIVRIKKMLSKNKSRGFTLIEVLVAVGVIATVGFVPISIVTQHLIQNALTPDRVRASLLAQEIIEYVRHDRDTDVLEEEGGKWFDSLYTLDCPTGNKPCYRGCTVYADDWAAGNVDTYCKVKCYEKDDPNNLSGQDREGECGTADYEGFISGIALGVTRGSNEKTCDGGNAKADGTFTSTLNLVIPREGSNIQYAIVAPCVSWKERNGAIKKTELQETVFQWIQKEE